MKLFVLILMISFCCRGQAIYPAEPPYPIITADKLRSEKRIDPFFSEWFLDILEGGRISTTTRIFKVNIGEPQGFFLPVHIYSGLRPNSFEHTNLIALQPDNHHLGPVLLDPLAGELNFFSQKFFPLISTRTSNSVLGLFYQGAIRLLSGFLHSPVPFPQPRQSERFLNGLATVGCFLQTNAWPHDERENMGNCRLYVRYIYTSQSGKTAGSLFGSDQPQATGWTAAAGIFLNQALQVRLLVSQYVQSPLVFRDRRFLQFSVSYSQGQAKIRT